MKVVVFASGSKGNLTLIETKNSKIIVDVGLRYQNIIKKFNEKEVDIDKITAIFLTHEHVDHVIGLKMLLKNHNIKDVYTTKGTLKSLDEETRSLIKNIIIIKADQSFSHDDLLIKTVMLSHDAAEPVGYVIENNNKKVVILTDTGYVDYSYYELLSDANLYILEANHNSELLMSSRRPMALKKRIISEKGHLSNEDAAWLINKLVDKEKRAIWIAAHISEDCNTNYLIEKALVNVIDNPLKIDLYFSSQETMDEIIL